MLAVAGQPIPVNAQLLDGFAAQGGGGTGTRPGFARRQRRQKRWQRATGCGLRYLSAVSHDLRTPLASIKASISTLRQTGVQLSAEDEAAHATQPQRNPRTD